MTEKNLLRESNKTTPYVGKEPQRRRRSGFFDDDDDDDARRTMTRPTSSSSSAAEKVRVVFLYDDDDDFCAFFSTSVFPLFFSPLDTRLWFVFSHSFSLSRTTTTTTTRDGTITGIVSGERVRAKAGKNASEGGNDPV